MVIRTIAAFFVIALTAWSCSQKTIPIQTERFYSDTTIIRETQVPVIIPGKTVEAEKINLDSLLLVLRAGTKPQIREIIKTDPESGQQIRLLIDSFGNLSAYCETQEQVIQVLQREIERLQTTMTNTVTEKKKGFFEKVKDKLGEIALILVLVIAILVLLIKQK